MSQQSEYHDDPPQDVERSPTPENELPPASIADKDAAEVFGKIVSTNFATFCAGFNDSALGVLIPYILPSFDIGLLEISYIYLINFLGCFSASFANIHICSLLGNGGTLVLGTVIQCSGYGLMFWAPYYPVFLVAFLFTGFGVSLQDAQCNSFTVTVRNSHRWLGVLHAIYGVGTILAPLAANAIASHTPSWQLYYLINLALGAINLFFIAWTFRHGLFKPNAINAKETASRELREILTHRTIWFLNIFFFLYCGAEITAGGWLVQFLVSVRGGDPEKVGYVASVFWSGFTLGRIALADVTHRFGERRMIFVYIMLAVLFQLMFWLVPNITANTISVCLLGFFIGPFYPVGLYVLTKLIPQELHLGAIGAWGQHNPIPFFISFKAPFDSSDTVTGFNASFGAAGAAAFPFLTGAIASQVGVEVLQPIMIVLLVGMAIFWALVPKQGRIQLT